MPAYRKIINDPVYGFITIDHPLIFTVISHPWYQRLRRIHQMAMAQLVYPGAVHSRLHHSLGAYHLMSNAIAELRSKGNDITPEEELSAKIAILLHDVGHGPFSHALENILVEGVSHEAISLVIMQMMNKELNGALDTTIAIFTGTYPKKYLHQLVSGQLDVDRMDYLNRDSFFTGVSEGVIGSDRILKMITVSNGELMIEEKGIYSIEKFLVARRLMYWQVYLHKTVLCAEQMLIRIMQRVKELQQNGADTKSGSITLDYFIENTGKPFNVEIHIGRFCELDDYDVLSAIKHWCHHPDFVLRTLCTAIINRHLFKIKLQGNAFAAETLINKQQELAAQYNITAAEAAYLAFGGEAVNTTYNTVDERINILFKDGSVKDISQVDNALIHQRLANPVKKFYICYYVA